MYKHIPNLVRITFHIANTSTSFSDLKYCGFNQILTECSILQEGEKGFIWLTPFVIKLVINTDIYICIEYNRKTGSF